MATVLGIISEYNPFHNGHNYHLLRSKQITKADYTIVVMGGNFTQRGDTSLVNKWSKAEMCLLNGVDLVIELPLLYSISSAENFANGAIKLFNALNIVNYISFGCETSDISILNTIANVLYSEPKEYRTILSHELAKGFSFPKARENALMLYLNDIRKYANVLSEPNNILGIEYLKSIKRLKSDINPIAIKRIESHYNSNSYSGNIASATAIRKLLRSRKIDEIQKVMPASSFHILNENIRRGHIVPSIHSFDKEILYTLRRMSVEEISNLPDVSEGLENAIKKAANSCNSIYELINIVNTKRYTQTRLQRILLYALLNVTKKDMEISKKVTPYARVLGFTKKGKYLLSDIFKANPKLEIVTSVKNFLDNSSNRNLKKMIEKDIWATNVYTLGFEYDSWSNLDYTQKLITL